MNEIIVRRMDMDWLKVIKLALNKKDWGRKYILNKIGKTELSCIMTTFDFERNKATFRLKLDYYGKTVYSNYEDIEYYLNNFTLDDFKMHLDKKIKKLIDYCISQETKYIAEKKYDKLRQYSWRITTEQLIANCPEEYDAIAKLSESEIKTELIDTLKDKVTEILNEPFDNAVEFYVESSRNQFKIEGVDQILAEQK